MSKCTLICCIDGSIARRDEINGDLIGMGDWDSRKCREWIELNQGRVVYGYCPHEADIYYISDPDFGVPGNYDRVQVMMKLARERGKKIYNDLDALRLSLDTIKSIRMVNVTMFDMYKELCLFVFNNPWKNTIKYKKMKGLLVDSILMGANDGYLLRWGESNSGLRYFEREPLYDGIRVRNDAWVIKAKLSKIQDELKDLVDNGLHYNAKFYHSMISMPSTPEMWRMACDGQFIESMCGYFRGNLFESFKKQVSSGEDVEDEEKDYPMGPYIVQHTGS
jgi:hypothetical protein